MFKDQYRAVMQYSLPRDAGKPGDNGSPRLIHHDWICAKVSLTKLVFRHNLGIGVTKIPPPD